MYEINSPLWNIVVAIKKLQLLTGTRSNGNNINLDDLTQVVIRKTDSVGVTVNITHHMYVNVGDEHEVNMANTQINDLVNNNNINDANATYCCIQSTGPSPATTRSQCVKRVFIIQKNEEGNETSQCNSCNTSLVNKARDDNNNNNNLPILLEHMNMMNNNREEEEYKFPIQEYICAMPFLKNSSIK